MDIQLPIQLPTIDLGTVIPLLALVLLAALILVALTARTLIKSRAFSIALVAAVVILGSSTIVGSLQSIALLIGVAGVVIVAVVIVLGRNPDVLDLLHLAVKRDQPTVTVIEPARQIAPKRILTQIQPPSTPDVSRPHTVNFPKDWGF